ncbi:M23 family metallopeptidase [Rahnella sp. C60]|nr:M23 family metallopeptidase [Rahnella perminowiae]
MRRVLLFLLLIPLLTQATDDVAVTLALIQATRPDVEVIEDHFSSAMLLTAPGDKVSEGNTETSKTSSIRYPHFLSPLNIPLRITSPFSLRWHPLMQRFSPHEGTDFAAPRLTPVLATEKGIVVEAMSHPTAGNYVVIRHPLGWRSRYLHLDRITVATGQEIERGKVIGYSGNTGRSTGPHLHFELMYHGQTMDSAKLLSASETNTVLPAAAVSPPKPAVPKIILVTEIGGQEKVMVKYKGKTIYAGANQTVFGHYKVLLQNGRYRLYKLS